MTSRDPRDLYAPLEARWDYLRSWWHREHRPSTGLSVKLSATFRDKADQDRAVAEGKSNAPFPQSLHNYNPAYAFDVFFVDAAGKADWDFAAFRTFGTKAKSLGLVWGGDWVGLVDGPHIQMPMTWEDARDTNIPPLPPLLGTDTSPPTRFVVLHGLTFRDRLRILFGGDVVVLESGRGWVHRQNPSTSDIPSLKLDIRRQE
jgi:hypothetical protein